MTVKVLIVEDSDDARDALGYLLRSEGFEVVGAPDGQCALDLMQSDRPDVVVTDIQMPNIDGIEMIKRLRLRPQLKDLPVIVLSSFTGRNLKAALAAGANVATSKFLDPDALVRLIRRLALPAV